MEHQSIPTNRKALKINLENHFYGSFAEIGGGQEVARNFFTAGGASGTVAKTISAYDKSFSDSLYNKNKSGRYVSEARLLKMLDREYNEVSSLLSSKHPETSFFAFANTVEVLNFSKTNYSHGWMGVQFQLEAGKKANMVILHVKLLENDGLLQQRTLGVLGVNLLYQFRITMMRMSGPDLDYVDNRLLGVQLVKNGMTRAIMFDHKGNVQQPSEMLYNKNVLAFRGSFRPITYVAKDILSSSLKLFQKDEDYKSENTLSFCEITLNNLLSKGEIDEHDFLERVNMLNQIGQNVMVTEIREYYKLVDFFSQFNVKKLRIVMGVPSLENLMDAKYYTHLKGGVLEALGKLFPQNLKLYIYPTLRKGGDELITSRTISLNKSISGLYQYLLDHYFILDIESNMSAQLQVKSREVLKMIQENNPAWEKYVPMIVAEMIKEKNLFL